MIKLPLYNVDGEKTGEVEVKDEIFNVTVKEHLVHSAVVGYLANQRRAQARTKGKGEVSGGGAKPWKQKGTGRARAGSNTSPIWRRGGVAHGPGSSDYSYSLPRKVRRKALCAALTAGKKQESIKVVENLGFSSPRTKDAEKILVNMKLERKTLLVVNDPDENVRKSFRNIKRVRVVSSLSLNTYDVIDCEHILITRKALEVLENRFAARQD